MASDASNNQQQHSQRAHSPLAARPADPPPSKTPESPSDRLPRRRPRGVLEATTMTSCTPRRNSRAAHMLRVHSEAVHSECAGREDDCRRASGRAEGERRHSGQL
jgi:hypothetical protein